jgi:hypothetical protein
LFLKALDLIAQHILLKADSTVTDPALAAELKKKRTFRTFSYRGIELEKLLDLSNEEVCRSDYCLKLKSTSIYFSLLR